MTQQVKRIDPYWHTHPMIPTGVAVGAILMLIGYVKNGTAVAVVGAVIAGLAIFIAANLVMSAVGGTVGLLFGVLNFLVIPNLNTADMSRGLKLVSVLVATVVFMVLVDAWILVLAVLYNLFSDTLGMGAVRLELEAAEEPAAQ